MKRYTAALWLVTLVLCWVGVGLAVEARFAPQNETGSWLEERFGDSEYPRGLIAPPFAPHRITRTKPLLKVTDSPVRFDWREQGVVTGVRQQGSCGACYAFAALGDIESKLLIAGEGEFDFSENNLKECEWFGRTLWPSVTAKCGGGTYWRVVNHMAEFGTVLEECDPYIGANSTCRQGCLYIKTVLNWRVFSLNEIPPVETMKSYVMQKGPIYAAIDAGYYSNWEDEFELYDGSYTLHYTDSPVGTLYDVSHAVVIVGWDDTLSHAGGQGAWICKNSWGTSWGGTAGYGTERGFLTIAYGSANLGYYASFLEEWQDYDRCEELLFHDEAGYYWDGGYGSTTAWGMCKFVMADEAELQRVEFWTTDATTDVDIYIYDDFDGTTLENLLASETDNSYAELGYHSVPLSSPIEVGAGEDVYIAVKITNAAYTYPLTTDPEWLGPLAEGMCYISPNGSTWSPARFRAQSGVLTSVDLGVRLRVRYAGDCDPPDSVSLFRAIPGDSLVTLEWTNPPDEDFSYVMVRYSAAVYPATPQTGTAVENGFGGRFDGEPSVEGGFIHTGLANDKTYYYSIFAADTAGNYSSPAMAAATPGNQVPPGSVIGFTAEGTDRSVMLKWTGPDDADLAGVRIRYSTIAPPLTLEEGAPVENGNGGTFATLPAASDSFMHSDLTNGTTYYYTIWAFDGMNNHSQAKNSQATAVDNVGPEFAVSVLQNPYLSNHLDIYLIASEAITETGPVVTVGAEEVEVEACPGQDLCFRYDYEIYAGGPLEITACGTDLALNYDCSSSSFNATLVTREAGGTATSLDGCFRLALPAGVLDEDTYVLIGGSPGKPESMASVYTLSPTSAELNGRATVSIAYSNYVSEPEHLCIARVADGTVYPLESYLDREEGRVLAYADRLGDFGLLESPGIETPAYRGDRIAIYPSIPNPFSRTTSISFTLPDARTAKVGIYTAGGRLVRELLDAGLEPGRHTLTWDGTDRWGARAADGIYFVRVSTARGAATSKIVMLR